MESSSRPLFLSELLFASQQLHNPLNLLLFHRHKLLPAIILPLLLGMLLTIKLVLELNEVKLVLQLMLLTVTNALPFAQQAGGWVAETIAGAAASLTSVLH